MIRSAALAAILAATSTLRAEDAPAPDYAARVAPILAKYCAGCHNDDDREGDFSLESFASLREGTPKGPAIRAGDAASSPMIRQLTGQAKPAMPPKGEPRPTEAEVAVLRAWIDSGAKGPPTEPAVRLTLDVPSIASTATARPVTALDASRDGKWLATARYAAVEILGPSADGSFPEGGPRRVLADFPGKVTAVHFTADGSRLVTASGVAGLGGVATIWDTASGSPIRKFPGHRDLLFDAELSPDGKTLATCGYDRTIRLWDAGSGRPLRTLEGHNGAVYDVAFSPDGRTLVSASADDTCKVWRVEDGLRLDTLPQPLKEEYCCTFSPDGRTIVAGGADSTIRVWEFVSRDGPRINPMVLARFAHEGPIVRLAFTPDGSRLITTAEDRTVKAWDVADYTELRLWERQPDVAAALAVAGDGRSFRVGRMDGSAESYPLPAARDRDGANRAGAVAADVPIVEPVEPARGSDREPNDTPAQATDVVAPAAIAGTIEARPAGGPDADLYRFSARAGERWTIEVDAARSGSKLDSFVEVLDPEGRRIERVRLQAVSESYFTFRGKDDATTNDFRVFKWEEMHLDEYLYSNGEVVKLWLYPRGPDSGFVVYPGEGKRWGYFDTTPLAHALGEPCYVVRPHPPGTALIPSGLPVFPLFFENDDESHREMGRDSRLEFTAPADGRYLVRIRDVRGSGGADHKYTMAIRPTRPDFAVTMSGPGSPIGAGDSREFKVKARRIDGFDGPIRVEVAGLPPGFAATSPLVIEAGQVEAIGLITAGADATPPAPDRAGAGRVTASASIRGREVSHPVNPPGEIKPAAKPPLRIRIGPVEGGAQPVRESPEGPLEFEVERGRTITLKVKVERTGFSGQVPLGNEGAGRNLPFGVYVDDIGLNGLLITADRDERSFFITADRAATPQTRHFHLTTTVAGGHSTPPVILRVK